MFIERTGMQTPWAAKIKTDLERVRALLLEQPRGPGGLPPGVPNRRSRKGRGNAPCSRRKDPHRARKRASTRLD